MTSQTTRLGVSALALGLIVALHAGGRMVAFPAEGEETPVNQQSTDPAPDRQQGRFPGRRQGGGRGPGEKQVSFTLRNVPWKEFLQGFAAEFGLSLEIDDSLPPGTVTYVDDTQYTLSGARDVLNGLLLPKGYYLAPRDKSLVVANLNNRGTLEGLVPSVTLDELTRRGGASPPRGRNEILSVAMPVPPAAGALPDVVEDLTQLLGKWGKVSPLRTSRAVLVQDTALNLRRIAAFLKDAETRGDKSAAPATRLETGTGTATPIDAEKRVTFSFRGASWKSVLEKFAQESGAKLELDDLPEGEFNYQDSRRYTLQEGLDIMNSYLLRKGYYLWRGSDDLIVGTSLKNGVPEGLVRRIPLSELPRRGGGEFLMVRIPVPPIILETSDDVEALVRPYLGGWGKVTFLPDTGEILVRDLGQNLQVLVAALAEGGRQKDPSKSTPTKIDAATSTPTRIDAPTRPTPPGVADKEGGSATDALAGLKSQYEESEREATRIAAEYQEARERNDADAKVAEIRSRLQRKIQEAFERRQETQRMEAAILRHQLQRVDDRLADRERLKDRITERRLQELLDPNVTWESPRATGDAGRP